MSYDTPMNSNAYFQEPQRKWYAWANGMQGEVFDAKGVKMYTFYFTGTIGMNLGPPTQFFSVVTDLSWVTTTHSDYLRHTEQASHDGSSPRRHTDAAVGAAAATAT